MAYRRCGKLGTGVRIVETGETYEFESQAEAARKLGVYQPNIRHVLSGYYKQTGGYRFEYLDKESFDERFYK